MSSAVDGHSSPAPDWDALRELSVEPHGFGDSRTHLWPLLLSVSPTPNPIPDPPPPHSPASDASFTHLALSVSPAALALSGTPHADERQIKLDTERSFVLYPDASSSQAQDVTGKPKTRDELKQELNELLTAMFRKRRKLHYFQGYHDIATVLLLTLPPPLHLPCLEKLSLHRLRDSMGTGLEPVLGLLRVLQKLLHLADPEYADLLDRTSPLPYHALSPLLTLFAHDVPSLPLIQHVFDWVLARPPDSVVWLCAAVVLSRKPEIEELEREGEEGMVHSLLSGLPDLYEEEGEEDAYLDREGTKGRANGEGQVETKETEVGNEAGNAVEKRETAEGENAAGPAVKLAKQAGLPAEKEDENEPSWTEVPCSVDRVKEEGKEMKERGHDREASWTDVHVSPTLTRTEMVSPKIGWTQVHSETVPEEEGQRDDGRNEETGLGLSLRAGGLEEVAGSEEDSERLHGSMRDSTEGNKSSEMNSSVAEGREEQAISGNEPKDRPTEAQGSATEDTKSPDLSLSMMEEDEERTGVEGAGMNGSSSSFLEGEGEPTLVEGSVAEETKSLGISLSAMEGEDEGMGRRSPNMTEMSAMADGEQTLVEPDEVVREGEDKEGIATNGDDADLTREEGYSEQANHSKTVSKEESPSSKDVDAEKESLHAKQESEPDNVSTSSTPHKARVSLPYLLALADELYAKYPPSHPSLHLSSIMGPKSVVFTWDEAQTMDDDDAEETVEHPEDIVLPFIEEEEVSEREHSETETEKDRARAEGKGHRERRRLRKSPRARFSNVVLERRTMVAGAVLVLGVAIAVYGARNGGGELGFGKHRADLRRMGRWVGGVLVGASRNVWEVLGH